MSILIATLGRVTQLRTRRDGGATAVEYALIAGFIAVVVSVSVGVLGNNVRGFFESAVAGF